MDWRDKLPGGLADDDMPLDFPEEQLRKGIKVEMEHTDDPAVALEIAMDHLKESRDYYDHLEDMEQRISCRVFARFLMH